MTSHIAIEKEKIQSFHEEFGGKICLTGCTTAAAAFLLIGALIVITCSCLCLNIPGVNAMTQVILPAVVPSICAILLSIPLIVITVKLNREKNQTRDQMMDCMVQVLNDYDVPEKPGKERVNFILENFLDWRTSEGELEKNRQWSLSYQMKILTELKERMGKEESSQNPRQKKIDKSLDEALKKLGER